MGMSWDPRLIQSISWSRTHPELFKMNFAEAAEHLGFDDYREAIRKIWLDDDGESHERVYDVALSDGREVGEDGSVPPVGNTVDLASASYTNSIGAAMLETHWEDPDFDRNQRAFYYVRVLEIPTPRWSTIDARVFGAEVPDGVDRTTQERAYTSPVWYDPEEG